MKKLSDKLCNADQAVGLIGEGDWIVSGGFVGAAHPEALTAALERRFLQSGTPTDLTLVYGAGQGDGQSRGLNHLGHRGLLARVIGGHWGLAPNLGRLANENLIEAYNFPQGVICQLLRDIAASRPGCITHVGLGTFADPDFGGGRLNQVTSEELVERIKINGKTWLFYRAFPVHAGLIRATLADCHGNLSMEEEAIIGEVLPIAQAVRNSGGRVIAQVKRTTSKALPPHIVAVPGVLVDRIVVAEEGEHDQTFAEPFNSSYCTGSANSAPGRSEKMPMAARKIIASRVCDELRPGTLINLGIGMPEGVAAVAEERGILQKICLTLESGPIGGRPASGLSFGASAFPEAIIDQPAQFDFYDGGGLDLGVLGMAQTDRLGNVNVSQFGDRLAGVGGFVNISQNAKSLVFCGTFTSGGLEVAVEKGRIRIVKEGRIRKFVDSVQQLSFNGELGAASKRRILYVTERAVFKLTPKGPELIEEAPGIDRDEEILAMMDFSPLVKEVKPMRLGD